MPRNRTPQPPSLNDHDTVYRAVWRKQSHGIYLTHEEALMAIKDDPKGAVRIDKVTVIHRFNHVDYLP